MAQAVYDVGNSECKWLESSFLRANRSRFHSSHQLSATSIPQDAWNKSSRQITLLQDICSLFSWNIVMIFRQRRLFWATIALAAFILWLLWPTECINPKSASQLLAGMSLTEVEHILGKPLDQSQYITIISSNITVAPPPMSLSGTAQPDEIIKIESPPASAPAPIQLNRDMRYHYRLMPASPWNAALELFGEPLPANWGPGRHMEFWAGSQVVIIGVFQEEKTGDILEHYLVVPVLRDGGGPLGWLKHHYLEWCSSGSSSLVAPALPPMPISPPPFLTEPNATESKETKPKQ